jgi:DNA-binding MarR family transcriptional regulator
MPAIEVPERWDGGTALLLTEQDLRMYARLLLHIARQGRYDPQETVSPGLTQAGIAQGIGATQGAISRALERLTSGGLVRRYRTHVPGRIRRILTYQLTEDGHALVERIRAEISSGTGLPRPAG